MANKKLKILYFTGNQKNYVKENWEYFKAELSKLHDVQVEYMSEGGHITKIIRKIGFNPDFIFFDDMKHTKSLEIIGLDRISIPKGILAIDVHGNLKFKSFVVNNKVNLIFALYRDGFLKRYPEFKKKLVWFPHHVQTQVFKDYHKDKSIDYLLMGGAQQRLYPIRHQVAYAMKDVIGFVQHKHPGYKFFSDKDKKKVFIGKRYAKEINRAKIFFTDDSIYKYPIAKYFEVTACNTLLLASGSKELEELGFIDKVTFINMNKNNFMKKAKYYIKQREIRNKIAKRGYRMVRKDHSTKIRAKQFVDCIKRYIGWKNKLEIDSSKPKWVRLYEETSSRI